MAINVNINVSNLGAAVLSQTNPAAQSWIRVETNGAITLRTAAETLSDLGAQAAGAYVTAVTASGNIASSGGTTPNITFTGVLPTANGGTAVNIASAALVLGTASTTAGQLTFSNATNAFTQTIRGTNPAASVIYDLPTTAPTLGQVLSATAPAAGVVTLSWATASSGITVGTTTITSGTTGRLGINIAGVYSESVAYSFTQGSPYNTVLGYGNTSTITGTYNTIVGDNSTDGATITTGARNTAIGGRSARHNSSDVVTVGYDAGRSFIGSRCVAIGSESANQTVGNTDAVYLGYRAGRGGEANYIIVLGAGANNLTGTGHHSSIVIGYGAYSTTTHQGILGSNNSNGYISDWYFNGVTHTAPYSTALRGSGGSGTNINGANFNIYAGLPTGDGSNTASGRNGQINFWTGDVGASGTTLRTATEKVRILQEGGLASLNYADGFILQDNAGTPHYWRVQVDSVGVLFTTDLGTTLPN